MWDNFFFYGHVHEVVGKIILYFIHDIYKGLNLKYEILIKA